MSFNLRLLKKPSPLTQMTIAMVLLCTMLIIMADLFFGVLPQGDKHRSVARQEVGKSVSVQIAGMLRRSEPAEITEVMDSFVANSRLIQSIGVRLADNELILQSVGHAKHWVAFADEEPGADQMLVHLDSAGARWGQVEILFDQNDVFGGSVFTGNPLLVTIGFVILLGGPAFWFYMRRALQHLDPASVVPERVQTAFDTMSDGVVVVDSDGRILLASRAFQQMNPTDSLITPGLTLSSLSWLATGLASDVGEHPWNKAMNENEVQLGRTLVITTAFETYHLVVGCSPIREANDKVRGCLVTFGDVTELHQTNEMLRETNQALTDSQTEIERQNEQLQRLATRDPLTGCLNRRALFDSFDALIAEARACDAPISCLIIDIDHFKTVNDTHGHGIGDRVIQEVAKRLLETTRSTDLVCRYGGEEFCIVLPGVEAELALTLGERIRERIEERAGRGVREIDGLSVTVSVGIDFARGADCDQKMLIDHADQALYTAKRSGRNRVCAHWLKSDRAPSESAEGEAHEI